MANESFATRDTERAALVAEVGECCLGGDPLCAGGCLVEKAIRSRMQSAERGGTGLSVNEADVIAAAVQLTPLLEEGWDDQDTPEDQNAGSKACDALVAAVNKMLKDEPTAPSSTVQRVEVEVIDPYVMDLVREHGSTMTNSEIVQKFLPKRSLASSSIERAPITEEFREFIGRLSDFARDSGWWDRNTPYGTRFYFGDGAGDYIARDVLQAFLDALKSPVSATRSITADQLEAIRDQCEEGLTFSPEHNCPATYALSAIWAELFAEEAASDRQGDQK